MESDESLRVLFQSPEYEPVLLETGYRKPLASLQIADKTTIKQTLKAQVLLWVKAEIDQYQGIPNPDGTRFMQTLVSLTPGTNVCEYYGVSIL